MSNPDAVNLTVLVDDDHKNDLSKVANALEEKGFIVHQILHEIGVLSGSAPAKSVSTLASIQGVISVEEERTDYGTQV